MLVDTAIVGRLGTAQLGGLAARRHRARPRRRRLQLPDLRHDRAGRPPARRRPSRATAADVAVQTMWLSAIVGLVVAPLVALAAPLVAGVARRQRRRLRLRRHLPADRRHRPAVRRSFALGAQGVQRGAADYRTPLVILLVGQPRQRRARGAVRVRLRLGRARLGVVDGDRPGRRRRRLRRRRPPPPRRPRPHRRPSWRGMAPLLTAGRHLLLRVGSMLAVTTGATAIAARVDEPTLAAHQIAASMFLFLALVLDALAIPAQTLVADELGQGSVAGAAELSTPLRAAVDHRRRGVRRRPRRPRARAARRLQRATLRSSTGRRPPCCGWPRCSSRRPSPSPTTAC